MKTLTNNDLPPPNRIRQEVNQKKILLPDSIINDKFMNKFLISRSIKQAFNFEIYQEQVTKNQRVKKTGNTKNLESPFSLPARKAGIALAKIWSDLYSSGTKPKINNLGYFGVNFTLRQFLEAYGLEKEQIGESYNFNRSKKLEAIKGLKELSEFAVIFKSKSGLKAQALVSFGMGDNSATLQFNGYTNFHLHQAFLTDEQNQYFVLPPDFTTRLRKVYSGRQAKDVISFLLFVASLKRFNAQGYKLDTVLSEMELSHQARRKKYVADRIKKAIDIAIKMEMIKDGQIVNNRVVLK